MRNLAKSLGHEKELVLLARALSLWPLSVCLPSDMLWTNWAKSGLPVCLTISTSSWSWKFYHKQPLSTACYDLPFSIMNTPISFTGWCCRRSPTTDKATASNNEEFCLMAFNNICRCQNVYFFYHGYFI